MNISSESTVRYFLKRRTAVSVQPSTAKSDLCFIDIETTGARFGYHEIIAIGAIRTSNEGVEVKGEWETKLQPHFHKQITKIARQINGFSKQNWLTAPKPSRAIWTSFVKFVSGCTPVCHNPPFERAFITIAAAKEGIFDLKLDYHWIGTESLGWPLFIDGKLTKLSLNAISEYFGLPEEPTPHTALNGAVACRKAYLALLQHHLAHR